MTVVVVAPQPAVHTFRVPEDTVNQTLHRSDNLLFSRVNGETSVYVELRFPTSMVRGEFDSACPRCSKPGKPEQWEIEGPDGRTNSVWLSCDSECTTERDTRWSRTVSFKEGWTDIG